MGTTQARSTAAEANTLVAATTREVACAAETAMNRRTFIGLITGGLLAAPLAAEAQKPGKTARVGILEVGRVSSPEGWMLGPFSQAMREFGWVEGKNLVIERRFGESADQLHAAAADLVGLKVDVVVVWSGGLANIVQGETGTIPIVVVASGYDMVTAGFAASLAKPGGNITGSQVLAPDVIGKQLQLLKEFVPNLSRVATLVENVTITELITAFYSSYAREADLAARTLGIKLDNFYVARPEDFPAAFRGMTEKGDRGLLTYGSPFTWAHRKQIVDLASTHRIAALYSRKAYVEAGGLMSYGPDYSGVTSRAAVYVDKILKGAKPADLPIEQPTKFELVINLKTAKALGLTIPPAVLGRADEVIE